MAKVVGIDLGTTYTLVSTFENGRCRVIPNAEGGRLTPSVVAFLEDGRRLVGQLAKLQAVANPGRTIFSMKGHMGRSTYLGEDSLGEARLIAQIKQHMGSEYRVRVNDRLYTPQEVSAMILQKVKADAEAYLGDRIEGAVITVPAYFNDSQRQATREAGIIAGLDVMRIISEPTAASLAYGLDREEGVHRVLVWDLGGGTFDVSILEIGEGIWEVKAVNGNTWLGGDDWRDCLGQYVADEFKKECGIDLRGDAITLQRLKEAAEEAKIELTEREEATIRMPLSHSSPHPPKHLETNITRDKFEELTADLLQKMVGPTKQALADAGLKPRDIDRVILVGGATRMPAVQELCRKLMGKEPYRDIDPDEVVAIGAGIQAGILTGQVRKVVLIDVTPLSLGIETRGGIFTKIIERNTPIPTTKSRIFTTARDNQPEVDIHVLQGEREMAQYNMTLDRFRLTDIPPAPRGEPQIEVTFYIDVDGIVHVAAHDLQTDNLQKIRISSRFTGLPQEEIKRMIKEAKTYAEEDKKEREAAQVNIAADSMIDAAEYLLREVGSEADITLVEEVEEGMLEIKTALAEGDSEKIKSATEALKRPADKLAKEINLLRGGKARAANP